MPEYKNNAGVWVKKTKNGDQYLAFRADRDIKKGEWLNLFKPKKRHNDKAPNFTSFDVIEDDEVDNEELETEELIVDEQEEVSLGGVDVDAVSNDVPF